MAMEWPATHEMRMQFCNELKMALLNQDCHEDEQGDVPIMIK